MKYKVEHFDEIISLEGIRTCLRKLDALKKTLTALNMYKINKWCKSGHHGPNQ